LTGCVLYIIILTIIDLTVDGRNFMIVVPPNVNPGDTFCLEIHNDAEGGATVVVAEVTVPAHCTLRRDST
jgi:hypothetical protein